MDACAVFRGKLSVVVGGGEDGSKERLYSACKTGFLIGIFISSLFESDKFFRFGGGVEWHHMESTNYYVDSMWWREDGGRVGRKCFEGKDGRGWRKGCMLCDVQET